MLTNLKNFLQKKFTYIKEYGNWEAALKHSTGYDSQNILDKVREATLKVKSGTSVYERDSVLFDEIQYSWPLLAGLMWIAAQNNGTLEIIDFGGSLGSTYFQNRKFLKHLKKVRWNIIEQKHYVEVGKRDFESEELKFYYNIESCLESCHPRAILFSGVLQYLEKPYELLGKIKSADIDFILIDRTPFHEGNTDRICVQTVPKKIFEASYPSWIFSMQKFKEFFKSSTIIEEFDSFAEKLTPYSKFKGFIICKQVPQREHNLNGFFSMSPEIVTPSAPGV